jgi:hypothetical protein
MIKLEDASRKVWTLYERIDANQTRWQHEQRQGNDSFLPVLMGLLRAAGFIPNIADSLHNALARRLDARLTV